jgi:hypothetical protein
MLLFSSELKQALLQSDEGAKTDGDPVLDFDPILASQDPAERYVVRRASVVGARCLADVYGVWSRAVSDHGKSPQGVAELVFESGRWQFTDFHYPDHTSPSK